MATSRGSNTNVPRRDRASIPSNPADIIDLTADEDDHDAVPGASHNLDKITNIAIKMEPQTDGIPAETIHLATELIDMTAPPHGLPAINGLRLGNSVLGNKRPRHATKDDSSTSSINDTGGKNVDETHDGNSGNVFDDAINNKSSDQLALGPRRPTEEGRRKMIQQQMMAAHLLNDRGWLKPLKKIDKARHDFDTDNDHETDLFVSRAPSSRVFETEDDESDGEFVEPARKRTRTTGGKAAASKTSKTNTTKAKRPKKVAKETRISTLRPSDIFEVSESNVGVRAQPGFDPTATTRKSALDELLASVPADSRNVAKIDRRLLDQACKAFGLRGVWPTNGGEWGARGMRCTLRPHQVLGTAFMLERERDDEGPQGGILADDMGLGKTIMTLATIVNGRSSGVEASSTTLIIATRALIHQWLQEIKFHCEIAKDKRGFGVGRCKIYKAPKTDESNDPIGDLRGHDILLVTYEEVLKSFPLVDPPEEIIDREERDAWWEEHYETNKGTLHSMEFFRIVVDEAHLIRNPETKKFRAVNALTAKHRWCLTGTPLCNGPADLYSLFKIVGAPDVTTYDHFKRNCCANARHEPEEKLTAALSKLMMRRSHNDKFFDAKIVSLPRARTQTLMVNFSPIERQIYRIIEERFRERINVFSRDGVVHRKSCSIFSMITRLRQCTSHPIMIQGTMLDMLEREDLERLNELTKTEDSQGEGGGLLITQLRRLLAEKANIEDAEHDAEIGLPHEDGIATMPPQTDQDEVPIDPQGPQGRTKALTTRFADLLKDLVKHSRSSEIESRKSCSFCQQVAQDPWITGCIHIYCRTCLEEVQHEAAAQGEDGAQCVECGQMFNMSEECGDIINNMRFEDVKTTKKSKKDASGGDIESWTDRKGKLYLSAKAIAVKAQIEHWLAQDKNAKIIVYTQWLSMVHIISRMCGIHRWKHVRYDGSISNGARQTAIEDFGRKPEIKILVASLKCGGLGLNLTMASRVICVDPWWNNALELQAFCRVFRIGQLKETSMLHLVVTKTIDERMQGIKINKQEKIDKVVDENQLRKNMSINDLIALFGRVVEGADGVAYVVDDGDD